MDSLASSDMIYRCQVLSQRHFSKGDILSINLPNVQFQKWQLPKGQVRPSEAPQAAIETERCGQDGLGGRALRLVQTWEVAAWEIAHLGICPLGKYPWEVAALGNAFMKVPKIDLPILNLSGIINPKVYIVDIKFSRFS